MLFVVTFLTFESITNWTWFIKKTAETFFLHVKSQNWEDSKWACQKIF